MPSVRVNDADLHYAEAGTGPVIVLVHGVWMSAACFRPQLDGLSDRFRVVALDLRGHGSSEHTPSGHTVAQYARDLRAFLEALDLADAVVAGWSMGALVLWDYVRQFGVKRLRGVVVIDQAASDYRWPDWPQGAYDLEALRELMSAVQTNRGAMLDAFVPRLFKAEPPPRELAALIREETSRPPASIASAIFFDQTVQDYRDVLPLMRVPALVCTGRDEKLVPVSDGEYLVERMPDARLVVFDESGHCPFLEEPQEFNRVLASFVDSL
jgi:pimeloyl-ACP methyl ester carboxylesterase